MPTMKAVRYRGSGQALEVESVAIPDPGEGDILVRMKSAGLCHSDFNLLDGHIPTPQLPITPGHEGAGVVEKVGPGVTNVQVDDDVGFLLYYHPCGHCHACRANNPMGCPINKMQGFAMDGYFSEYCLVDSKSARKLPEGMDVTIAAPLFCAGLTAWHAVRRSNLEAGEWIAIIGVGGLGHLAIQYAVKMGLKVVAVDINEAKLEQSRRLGASAAFNSRDSNVIEEVTRVTSGVAAACVFTSAPSAFKAAVQMLRLGGTLMCVGVNEGYLPVSITSVALRFVQIQGATSGTPEEMPACIEFSHKHGIRPEVETYRLEQFPEMVELMHKGETGGRLIVQF